MTCQSEIRALQLRMRFGGWLKKPLADKLRTLAAKVRRAIDLVEDAAFERRHRLECGGFIHTDNLETEYAAALPHARAYQAVRCADVRELIAQAQKTGIAFDTFIDLGSGKGKACFYAASRRCFRRIIGVEFSTALVSVANSNKQKFGALNINFLNMDAASYVLPAGHNLVFMFNPFGEVILRKFLETNMQHFKEGRSVIAYANDHQRLCLAKMGFSTIYRSQDTNGSLHQFL